MLRVLPSLLHTNAKSSLASLVTRSRGVVTLPATQNHNMPEYFTLTGGKKLPHLFSDAEFERRLSGLRRHMQQQDIEASVFTSYHNINYLTGWLYCYVGRCYGLVVTQDDTAVLSSLVDGEYPWRRSRAAHSVIYTDWHKDNYWKALRCMLGEVRGKIGCEFDHLSVASMNKLKLIADRRDIVDVAEACMYMRMIKSPEEHEITRAGARICDLGAEAMVKALKESGAGTPEYVPALAAQQAMVPEIAKVYPSADIQDTWTWLQSGINSDGAHNPLTSRKIQKGDIMVYNGFPMIQGYFSAIERTFFLAHCDDASRRIWEINVEVHKRGCEVVKPGITCQEVAHELNDIYKSYDLLQYRTFGYGHSFGNLCHYYGREAGLELREDVKTRLEPGMVLSMEPMLMLPQGLPGAGGYREHDILIVTDTGNENLTRYPLGPEHNII